MFTLFKPNPERSAVELAYLRIVAQARRPGFFLNGGVPDTLDGRFELICLHAFLYLHRLKGEQPRSARHGRRFVAAMVADFDRSLREMGTGDLSVGREVKRMAEAFYGRFAAYEQGLAAGDAVLRPALARNLFGTTIPDPAQLAAMAAYVRAQAAALREQDAGALLAGDLAFGDPPVPAEPLAPVEEAVRQ
ncbi:MAG: ubiquinol-cytochrome C chaperone family protein [Alphaproteobacteria bacterium]